ncbi:ABC transporter permease [Ochrobactrum sp. CM-21-5]|nr:ABC transporter permease [Ochrobactrum sp. CM-21-5]MBC2887644.1 ABC transporter permease [Ochrobactrum sp. CM-21-5]
MNRFAVANAVRSLLLYGSACVVIFFLILPILVIIPISFSADQYLKFPPSGFSLQWYRRFFLPPEWMESLWLSVRIAIMSTVMTLAVGVPGAIAMVRGRFPGKSIIYAILLSPMIVPTIITGVAIYLFFSKLGMIGSPVAMALGHTVLALPLMIIIVSASLQGFDQRLEQAAYSLGAGRLQTFRYVTMPLIAPGVISGTLFSFLSSFDELIVPLFLAGTSSFTLPVRIWNSVFMQVEPTIAAVSTFLIGVSVIVLMISHFAQRLKR